jgi:osmotically-inducible protein OsmY
MAHDRDRFERDRYDRDRHERDDRSMINRAGDEVRSWFGDDDAQRRRERDEREHERWNREERWRGSGQEWGNERNYGSDRPYGDRDYVRPSEPLRSEGYRDYGDRFGRSYGAPIDRDRFANSADRPFGGSTPSREFGRGAAFQPYARGSQEFGPEGYGSASSYSTRGTGGEWQSSERWRVPGPHSGRGPKGYQRSEERIREEINDRLTAHGLVDATDVDVQIKNGEVTLTGFVDSRAAKHAAEDCAEDVHGVREVHNHLRIRSHADDSGVGRTSVLGLTEHDAQNRDTARTLDAREGADAATRSRSRNP